MKKKINKSDIFLVLKEFESGKQNSALKKMEKYLKFNQSDFDSKYNYGVMLEKNGQIQKAIFNYKEVLKNQPNNWRALSNLYLIYFEQKKYAESMEVVNELLKTKPNHQPTLRDKAHLQFYLNDLKEAKLNGELSVRLNPKDYIALNVLGMIYDKMGLFQKAKEVYLNAIEITTDAIII